jgi:glycosyltransferase involved in cell wall biosynthesis
MTLRVVHVASGREWRGGQKQVWLTARALDREADIDQVVVTSRGSELARRLEDAAIPIRLPRWRASLDPRAFWAIRSEGRTPCVLHAHDSHALVLAGVTALRGGCRLVATRRTAFPLTRPGFWNRADRVIAISEAVKRVLESGGVHTDRITVVHSGIDLDEIRASTRVDPRSVLGLAPDTLIATAVGALDRHKGQSILVRAAAAARTELPNLHWVLVGEGTERAALERQIEQLGVSDSVHLLGHYPDAGALIGGSDVMVSTPIAEGLGTSILDAMALGVPVVASETGGIPELLAGGAGLLVPAGAADGVARAVVRILTQESARADMVRLAAARVVEFTDTRMAEALASVYRSVQPGVDSR